MDKVRLEIYKKQRKRENMQSIQAIKDACKRIEKAIKKEDSILWNDCLTIIRASEFLSIGSK